MEIEPPVFCMEDRMKQQTFEEDNFRKQNEPSQSQLCETVLLLKQIMPHRSLERAIIMLHQTLVKEKTPQEIYENNGIQPVPLTQAQPRNSEPEITKIYLKGNTNKIREDFTTENEWNRFKDKRAVAKSFVAKGYGHQFAIEQLKKSSMEVPDQNLFSFNKDVYKQTISATITQAFRKLEIFLSQDCKKKITPINKAQMKKLMTPLLSSTTFAQHINTFKKYLRYLYGLSNVTLCEGESVRLYLEAMRFLNGRPVTMEELEARYVQPTEKPEPSETNSQNHDNSIKSANPPKIKPNIRAEQSIIPQEDLKLVKMYLENHSLSKCFACLTHQFESMSQLRSRFFNILRSTLNNLEQEAVEGGQKMEKISERTMENILMSKKGLPVRLHLLEYFVKRNYQEMVRVLNTLNQFSATLLEQQSVQESLINESENHKKIEQGNEDTNEVKQEEEFYFNDDDL